MEIRGTNPIGIYDRQGTYNVNKTKENVAHDTEATKEIQETEKTVDKTVTASTESEKTNTDSKKSTGNNVDIYA